jgi:AcrR family transcriptional regulator
MRGFRADAHTAGVDVMATRGLSRPRRKRRAAGAVKEGIQPRALRTRELLKRATLAALNEKGFHSLRVRDVTEKAGVASGLFYRYFQDLNAAVAEVCSTLFDELVAYAGELTDYSNPYRWIYLLHRDTIKGFSSNPGVLACLFGLAGNHTEFDEIWKRNAHSWNLQVGAFLRKTAGFPPAVAERMGFVLGAMTEGVIYQALIRHTEDLTKLGRRPEDIADVIATMWYRAIFLANPPFDQLRAAGRKLAPSK